MGCAKNAAVSVEGNPNNNAVFKCLGVLVNSVKFDLKIQQLFIIISNSNINNFQYFLPKL